MVRLCFGTYATILKNAVREPNNQTSVTELLLGLITDNENITNQQGEPFVVTDKIASDLFGLKIPMRKKIIAASSSKKIMEAARDYFEDVVVPEIIPDLISDLLAKLCELITSDKDVPKQKQDEFIALATVESLPDFLSSVFLYALKKPNKQQLDNNLVKAGSDNSTVFDDAQKLMALFEKFKQIHPTRLIPPDNIDLHEMVYVKELLAAYADAEGLAELPKEVLEKYPRYKSDFERRRKDYYAAETIRRGSRDVFGNLDPDQFDILKEETYDGIIDVYSIDYPHGFERLNRVMSQAAVIRVDKCLLSRLPDWIGSSEKKGVCHILVNDGKLKGWVKNESCI
ncbi:hypothetical protein SCACP_26030 [Sporomusa carbonis]|uniref:ABC-three component system protein n=1 Tax=Sporomusa carbonis TaxID=3076075 RepID=UPI003A6954E6